jgi:broad specificity phosphatase PhoE
MSTSVLSVLRKTAIALAAAVLVSSCTSDNQQARTITLTFVRHAQSEGNASGLIDTGVPGPQITAEGHQQADQVARALGRDHDGIFASNMVRTQETAQPLSQELGEPVDVLPGLREIAAGTYEGTPEAVAWTTYLVAPLDWLAGDRTARIPGSVDGNEFNDEFTGAVQKIYDSGDSRPVAFSHGGAIMLWTLLNVKNSKPDLLKSHPLPNTAKVVVTGNPVNGWTLLSWDGLQQSP